MAFHCAATTSVSAQSCIIISSCSCRGDGRRRALSRQEMLDRKHGTVTLQFLAMAGLGFRTGSPLVFAPVAQQRCVVDVYGREIRPAIAHAHATVSSQQQEKEKEKEVFRLPVSVDYISSRSNAYVKHLVRLRQNPKTRSATESVLVVGAIPLREICESIRASDPFLIEVLLVRDGVHAPEELARASQRIVRVSSDAMSKLSGLDSPPEIAGVLRFPTAFVAMDPNLSSVRAHEKMRGWCRSPRRILVLDSIQDPGNMGTLLRTAAAFAWDGVFLLHGCCDPFNDKALRGSRGASFRVPIGVGNWDHVRDFAIANELKLYAGDPEPPEKGSASCRSGLMSSGEMDKELKVSLDEGGRGLCLVLGSEGQGLSEHVTRDCVPIGIPMPGEFESLNVAVAGGILMFLLRWISCGIGGGHSILCWAHILSQQPHICAIALSSGTVVLRCALHCEVVGEECEPNGLETAW